MDVTKPYIFIGFGTTEPLGFGKSSAKLGDSEVRPIAWVSDTSTWASSMLGGPGQPCGVFDQLTIA